jgi:phosphate-selective porin OprO and OprP
MNPTGRSVHWQIVGGAAVGALIVVQSLQVRAEEPGTPPAADTSLNDQIDAAEADGIEPRRQLVDWNHYKGPYFTLRVGAGFGYDYATYAQDETSKEQLTLSPDDDVRDFRLLFKGNFPRLPRLSYTLGYMYDGSAEEWRFRQTGLMVDVPELLGSIFVGRTKEGFSSNKIMVGYYTWTAERATMNEALIPILADGVKWTGRIPSGKLVYNIGYYGDELSQAESFNKNDSQLVGRAVWLPRAGSDRPLLHLALQARFAEANDGQLLYRSRPEAFQAQSYAIDTGRFPADHANAGGVEAYYRPGSLMFGMEYFLNQVSSSQTGDPSFHGGEVFAAYLFTGEVRPYNTRGAFFENVSQGRPLFDGGPGAWEGVLRFSYSDFDSGTIRGGRFWRITPMVNWYLSDQVRTAFTYGYGSLDRFGETGSTQFFEARLQVLL